MHTRLATLDDTLAISALVRQRIERWQRLDDDGNVEDLPYDDLSIYERWLHGGAWMSVETAALWLSHLLRGAGIPLVLEDDASQMRGYAEIFAGDEPEPYGTHWHLAKLITAPDDDDARHAMMQQLLDRAAEVGRLTVASTAYDEQTLEFYKRYAFSQIETVKQVNISAKGGSVGFYRATPHTDTDYEQIRGWHMPIGRTHNARFHWETHWANLWEALPRMRDRRTHRQHFSASGQQAYVCCQQQLYDPRSAHIYCWTPKTLSSQLINAIRDWAYREGYRTLILEVDADTAAVLGETEDTPRQQAIFMRKTHT